MSSSNTTVTAAAEPETLCQHALVVSSSADGDGVRVFGLSARERLERTFSKLGLAMLDPRSLGDFRTDRGVLLCGDHFFDERLIAALAERSESVLLVIDEPGRGRVAVGLAGSIAQIEKFLPLIGAEDKSTEKAAVRRISPTDLVPAYDAKLRKHSPPYVLPVEADRARETEKRIFAASYKGATDFVTKFVWPLPARIVTGWCARRRITPNMVTGLSYALTFLALAAFWRGDFAIGLVSGWLMTFFDTVDGKLARVTLTSTKLGDVLDHGLDLVHPPLWWAAWAVGLVTLGDLPVPVGASMLAESGDLFGPYAFWVAVVVGGYVAGRLLEGIFILAFGQEMFTWRPFDFAFRHVIARRNPNLVMLSLATLFGRPDLGFIAIGVWTLICLFIQSVRIVQAAIFRMRGNTLRPFAESPDSIDAADSPHRAA
jgi:phosphatidylglycerophosphate synthase